jgi:hypothetical protein
MDFPWKNVVCDVQRVAHIRIINDWTQLCYPTSGVRIPAPLLCYWMGEPEIAAEQ